MTDVEETRTKHWHEKTCLKFFVCKFLAQKMQRYIQQRRYFIP